MSYRVCGAGFAEVNGLFEPVPDTDGDQFANANGCLLKKASGSGMFWEICSKTETVYGYDKRGSETPPLNGWMPLPIAGGSGSVPLVFEEVKPGAVLRQVFGQTPEGETVDLFCLRLGAAETSAAAADESKESKEDTAKDTPVMEVEIMSYGCYIRSLRVPNKDGVLQDVVVGLNTFEDYLTKSSFFGCIAGRYANRIAKGKFTLAQPSGDEEYSLACNNGPNSLHGGLKGFDKKLWKPELRSPTQLALTYTSEDGEEGYPCRVALEVVYTVLNTADGPTLAIDYTVTNEETDGRKTVINLTNHSYFNLGGDFGDYGIVNHVLHMPNTTRFTAADETSIPTGELRPVKDTVFDFSSKPAAISKERLTDESDDQIKNGNGFDHNFIIDPNVEESSKSLVECARVHCPKSGISMRCLTEEPGFQFYTANFLDGTKTGKGQVLGKRGSFCIETQHWPDSPNHSEFPSTQLSADKPFKSSTHYTFTRAFE